MFIVFFSSVFLLFLPAILTVIGFSWKKNSPRTINSFYGYRTGRSQKNQRTWDFAQQTIAEYWRKIGIAMMFFALVPFIVCIFNFDKELIARLGLLIFVQLFAMFVTVYLTENKLKKTFDENGNLIIK